MKQVAGWGTLALVVVVAGWAAANRVFLQRYVSYLVIGSDPLTVPVDWFVPTAPLGQGFGRVLPVAASPTIPAAALRQAENYAEDQGSLALLVARNGQIELERYWQGFGREQLFNPQSMSKTVLALTVGIAVGDGAIASVDDPIERYLPRLAGEPRGQITVRHLLQMSGGLAQIATDYRAVPWSKGVQQHFGTDFNAPIFELALVDEPGSRWDYNNNETNLLGLVLEQATGEKYQDYLARKLWRPLGLGTARMYLDQAGGNVMKSCCILSRPIDWLTLGQLMLDRGHRDGEQLVPVSWIDEMLTPAAHNPGYGYQIWLGDGSLWTIADRHPDPTVYTWWGSDSYHADDIFVFVGHGYQNVWVVPSLDLVIVRATRQWPSEPWDVSRIPNTIIDAL